MKALDVLFVAPPFSYGVLESLSSRSPPLGIASIAAVLEQAGYSVKILDAFTLNMQHEEIINNVKAENPKIIAAASVTANFPITMDLLRDFKKELPHVKTIYGGPHATILPETAIGKEGVDFVVIGEAEYTVRDLVEHLLQGKGNYKEIPGICYLNENKKTVRTAARELIKNLDELPMPAYHLLPMDKYRAYAALDVGRKFSTMMTSRGCTARCAFCTSVQMNQYKWRQRSPVAVADEIEYLNKTYGISHMYFQDDEFTVNHKRVLEICDEIKRRNLDVIWECLTRVSNVKEDILQKMYEGGCRSIIYGVECGYQEGIDRLKKFITLEQVERAVILTKKAGIQVKCSFLIGFPWEGEKEIRQTIAFAKKIDADITYFNTLNPYYETPIFKEVAENNLFVGEDATNWEKHISHGTTPMVRTKYLTAEEVAYWNGRAYFELYTRPKFIIRKLKEMRNWADFKRNWTAGKDLLSLSMTRMLLKAKAKIKVQKTAETKEEYAKQIAISQ